MKNNIFARGNVRRKLSESGFIEFKNLQNKNYKSFVYYQRPIKRNAEQSGLQDGLLGM
jgi:hypothetical protein